MSTCKGITKKGTPCTKRIKNGIFCHLHTPNGLEVESNDVYDPPFLPREIWNIIMNEADLVTLGNLHLVSHFFYHSIRQRIASNPYHTILLDNRGINVSGNTKTNSFSFFIRSNGSMCEYIIRDKIIPYDIEANKLSRNIILPLIYSISNYKVFCEVLYQIKANQWHEDSSFTFNGSLDDSVHKYVIEKKVQYLVDDIVNKFPSTEEKPLRALTHKLPLLSGVQVINWRKCEDIIREVSRRVRQIYPRFTLFLPYGKFYYSFDGITSY